MGLFENMEQEMKGTNSRLDKLLDAQERELAENALARKWATLQQLADIWQLEVRSIKSAVKAGKKAGVVKACAFRVSAGGKIIERVDVASFERWAEQGGVPMEGGAA